MKYLLDTHALLWFLYDDPQLSDETKNVICNAEEVYVSIASLWEIAIKKSIGKLEIDYSIMEIANVCENNKIKIMPIKPMHLDWIARLPMIHNDPFDRLIISQAKAENLVLISRDSKFSGYNIDLLW